MLAKRIGAAGVVTGDDFTFGKGRSGDVELLRTLGAEHGIVAEAVAPVLLDGERISSGRIREALIAGDTGHRDQADEPRLRDRGRGPGGRQARSRARLSDREHRRSATTSGRSYGIYAVRVTLEDGSEHPGVASLGVRPTF